LNKHLKDINDKMFQTSLLFTLRKANYTAVDEMAIGLYLSLSSLDNMGFVFHTKGAADRARPRLDSGTAMIRKSRQQLVMKEATLFTLELSTGEMVRFISATGYGIFVVGGDFPFSRATEIPFKPTRKLYKSIGEVLLWNGVHQLVSAEETSSHSRLLADSNDQTTQIPPLATFFADFRLYRLENDEVVNESDMDRRNPVHNLYQPDNRVGRTTHLEDPSSDLLPAGTPMLLRTPYRTHRRRRSSVLVPTPRESLFPLSSRTHMPHPTPNDIREFDWRMSSLSASTPRTVMPIVTPETLDTNRYYPRRPTVWE
jgi:hypothetical protein